MKKIGKILVGAFVAVAIGWCATTPALAATVDDVRDISTNYNANYLRVTSDIESANSAEDVEAFKQALTDLKQISVEAKDKYAAAANDAQTDGWRNIAQKLEAAASDMAASAQALIDALEQEDADAYTEAINQLNDAETAYNDVFVEANTYIANNPLDSGDTQYVLWFGLLVLSIVCLVGAIIMVAATRTQHGTVQQGNKPVGLKDIRRNVLIGAGVFVAGAAIPAVQYWWGMNYLKADGTFEYYIFYWPLILGAVLFVGGLVQYLSVYTKLKKAGELVHSNNAAEMAGLKIPKIGSKATPKDHQETKK
jgi:cytochrome c556